MSNPRDPLIYRVCLIALTLAFIVVLLGAYTRLKDAGLGCPDWPGCYGHPIVPKMLALTEISADTPPLVQHKAWSEMIHRYIAGTVGLLVFFIAGRAWLTRKKYGTPVGLPAFLAVIVLIQASLGRWTVTLKLLPPIVMFHLIGGMTLVALLSLLVWRLGRHFANVDKQDCKNFRIFAFVGLILLIIQIFLGGWTSANYAALVCQHLPYCGNDLIPPLNFGHAFTLLDKIGPNYQGGLLDRASRITIQFIHRCGALVVFFYWFFLCCAMIYKAHSATLLRFSSWILFLLVIQFVFGVMNIILSLPIYSALGHNAVATLLLVIVVAVNYALYPKKIAYQK